MGRPRKHADTNAGNRWRRANYKREGRCTNCGRDRDRPGLLRCEHCEAACRQARAGRRELERLWRVAAPRQPWAVPHQVIRTIQPPLAGSVALSMLRWKIA